MFCFQCEQTSSGKGCTKVGVCGKQPETAGLQDLIIYGLQSIAVYAKMAREIGIKDDEVDLHTIESLFTTVTNVSFDDERLAKFISKTYAMREKIKKLFLDGYKSKNGKEFSENLPNITEWKPSTDLNSMVKDSKKVRITALYKDEDIKSLKELLKYGLKGMAAYADHAHILGEKDEEVISFFYKGLAALADESLSVDDLVKLNMEFGQVNLKCMGILNKGHITHFGKPTPTKVSIGVKKGPCILISGHDLLDLEALLKQTEGKGINIYTHGEMIPAHGYPELKKYKHLVGNYGSAWQHQRKEFETFPGAILMTTNCIQKPKDSYIDRIFTTGLVAFPGVDHISDRNDFSKVINKAIEMGGFKDDKGKKEIMVGFGHDAVLGVAPQVIEAVKNGSIKHFFLVGGYDGAKNGRNYYTELAESIPKDCIIMTLACGKYRFNKLNFGTIGEFPRLMDVGQCNDAYSAIIIATELAKAFNCTVNELPLSIILSWYEQKAVCVLLTLLSLGIKNIKLGPTLPAFISPNVLDVLVKNFNIAPTTTVESDLKDALNK